MTVFNVPKMNESYFQKRNRRQEQRVSKYWASYWVIRRKLPSVRNFSSKHVTCNRFYTQIPGGTQTQGERMQSEMHAL